MAPNIKYRTTLKMEEQTRERRQFQKTETDLSNIESSASTLTKTGTIEKIRNALSYFGKKNPFPSTVTSKDTLWLLDNTAYRNQITGKWEAEYVAAVFSRHSSCVIADAVSAIAKEIELGEDDPDYPTIEERIQSFTQDIKPGTNVKAMYRDSFALKLGPGGRNGISTDIMTLPGDKDGDLLVPTIAKVPKGASGILEMKTFLAEPEGWGVISGSSLSLSWNPS